MTESYREADPQREPIIHVEEGQFFLPFQNVREFLPFDIDESDNNDEYATVLEQKIEFNVEQCDSFNAWGEPSLFDMQQIATIIEPKADGIVFYKPGKFAQRFPDRRILPSEYESEL